MTLDPLNHALEQTLTAFACGRYQLMRILGAGGQKMVYLVKQRPLGLRHLIGSDAVFTALFAKILPANLWHRIMSLVLNRLQLRYVR